MRYVMIDTNIFIDMIIDRKHNVSDRLVKSFIKLLDFDEIKLVVPEIVVHETNKHMEEQLEEVGKKIKAAIKSLEDIYGINGYKVNGLEIKEYKNNSKHQLTELFTKYESNKSHYLREIKSTIKMIFEHPNCTIIEDTEQLRSLCMQRRIYKLAPFHHEKKESYADGLIVETLIHLSDYVPLNEHDKITFVTGNTSDFSKRNEKKKLHEDIYGDLIKRGLDKNVQYITSFGELIGEELKAEVANANLKESETEKIFTNIRYYDTITVFKNISIGLDSTIYFYNYAGKICTLDEVSGISDILRLDSDYLPVFYIYILLEHGETVVKEKREIFLRSIGMEIGNKLKEHIVKELKGQINQMEE